MDYYLIFDLGTTKIKVFAYSEAGEIIKTIDRTTRVIFPEPGWVEEDPLHFWEETINAGKAIVDELGPPKAVGITNQRSSTVLWDKKSGEPVYNMITWQDTRASELAEEYTKKGIFKIVRGFGKFMKGISKIIPPLGRTKKIKFLISAANFRFGTNQPIMHIRWLMDNEEEIMNKILQGEIAFGTMDSWILFKLLGKHITDYTNASATGMFDPFYVRWSKTLMNTVGIPTSILPKLVDVMGPYGESKELENAPVASSIADQQASLYNAGGTNKGTVKITNGTGAFIDINVGTNPIPMSYGVYPMIALKHKDETYYLLEGIVQAVGSAIDWLVDIGILPEHKDATSLAESVKDTAGVVFFPALAGLGTPFWNPNIKGLIYGLTRATTRAHLIRALLEGLAMNISEALYYVKKVSKIDFSVIIVDGGASKIDFLLKSIADFSGLKIRKLKNLEGTSRGAFLLARGAVKGLSLKNAWIPPEIEYEFLPEIRRLAGWESIKLVSFHLAKNER